MPPRHSKSEFASYLMPAWFLGRNSKLKIIQATHNTELAVRFGRKVRDLLATPDYRVVFPDTNLKADDKAAGRWGTAEGGEYFAAGVGAAMTGRGADLLIIDDPHSEQDALSSTAFDHAFEWYSSGITTTFAARWCDHYCYDALGHERLDRSGFEDAGAGLYG